jgi:hypothetical protein
VRSSKGPFVVVLLAGLFGARAAHAQAGGPSANAPPIKNSQYSVDLFQGPITTASRVIGLAGAYTALAEWCEGEYANAASPAVRAPGSLNRWDFDVCLGFSSPGNFRGVDFFNRGPGYDQLPVQLTNANVLSLGLELQYRSFGMTADVDNYRIGIGNAGSFNNSLVLTRVLASVATTFAGDQMVVGVGLKSVTISLAQDTGSLDQTLISGSGVGVQVGGILKPTSLPVRFGVTYRTEVDIGDLRGTSQSPDGSQLVNGSFLPVEVVVPWELELGTALELGQRPLNPRRIDTTFAEDQLRARADQARLARADAYAAKIAAAPEERREAVRHALAAEEARKEAEEDAEIERNLDRLGNSRRARADLWDRKPMLLLVSALVTGATTNGVGLDDAIAQRNFPAGRSIVVSPRLAFETEVVPRWLMLRGGTYLEPARYADTVARAHATLGTDIRLFRFNPWGLFGPDPWRIRLAADGAPRYFNWSVSIGKYQ